MIIYKFLASLIKLFSLAVVVILTAVSAYLVWIGADFTLTIGELWAMHDSESLGLAQVIVERYIYYPLWDYVVNYVLLQPAYVVLPIGVFGSLGFTYLILKF